jgi:hypothetical protein
MAMMFSIMVSTVVHASTTTWYSAQFCSDGGEGSGLGNTDHGLQGYSVPNEPNQVTFCPTFWQGSSNLVTVDAATLMFYDNSTDSDVSCYVAQENWDYSIKASSALFSCGVYGGCAAANRNQSWTGGSQLNFTNPVNNGTAYYTTSLSFDCSVPDNNSYIAGYNFTIN